MIDTSTWFAYFLPTDADHQRIRQCFRSSTGSLITTDYCVDETLTLLVQRETKRTPGGRPCFSLTQASLSCTS